MVVGKRKTTNGSNPTVRFNETPVVGILKTDGRRQRIPPENNEENDKKFTFSWTMILSTIVLLCAIVALTYRGYLDTRAVNYPYEGPKVIQKNSGADQTLWGTYRPGAYLGLRTKEPLGKGSVAAGLMWYTQQDLMRTGSIDSIRHMCDNAHENLVYGYVEHDTINYGHQVINDGKYNGFRLQTIFLRPNYGNTDTSTSGSNADWTTRIIYETNNTKSSVSLVWYVYIDPEENNNLLNNQEYSLNILKGVDGKLDTSKIIGSTPSLSDFKMSIIPIASKNIDNLSKFTVNINTSTSSSWCSSAALLKQCLARTMAIKQNRVKNLGTGSQIMLVDENHNSNKHPTSNLLNNFIAVQVTISHKSKKLSNSAPEFRSLSYSLDVAYTQKNKQRHDFQNMPPSLIADTFDLMHKEYSNRFRQKFLKTFPITLKEDTAEKHLLLDFARVTFSNMAGSLGYFYGSSLVIDDDNEDEKYVKNSGVSKLNILDSVKYWRAGLLTAVPSRSQFPRGFLWDDGFHGLMLGSWSIKLQLHILGHWMDLLNHQGWIPREQILGSEARSRVPEEFVVQSSRAANPPALLLTVNLLLKHIKRRRQAAIDDIITVNDEKLNFDKVDSTLRRLYPRLKAWYKWFNRTQRAVNSKHSLIPTNSIEFHLDKRFVGFRWRGRDALTSKELNPKTLTSGMDDYPRSSHPVSDDGTSNLKLDSILRSEKNDYDLSERHVDLHCWMAHGARIMNNLQNYLQPSSVTNSDDKIYSAYFWMLVESLDRLHWSEENDTSKIPMYADYGIHTDNVKLVKIRGIEDPVRIVGQDDPPRWRFVDSHIGYNALFPMFFRLVKNSQRLNAILDIIEGISNSNNESPVLLTKGCGLRSLSKNSPLYKVKNTKHDPPYWRGSVWINMQYLACSSLYYYANLPEATDLTYMNDKNKILEPIQHLDLKTKQRCKQLYDKIRNDVIKCVYTEWKRTGYVWEQYEDEPVSDNVFGLIHKGKGTRPFTGWSANVVLLMAEIY